MSLTARLIIAFSFVQVVVSRTCPGGRSVCPDTATCCLVGKDTYGCCPIQDAVCCSDHAHCCPHATKCDVEHGQCLKANGESVKMRLKMKAKQMHDEIICPDQRWKCPLNTTCCKVGTGKYGCCPMLDAVCCADQKHCCPEHTKCDEAEGRCLKQDGISIRWVEKQAGHLTKAVRRSLKHAIKNNQALRICEDGKISCTGDDTCCEGSHGKSRCCPFKNGVCCPGTDHCCPEGYQCEKEDGSCVQEGDTFFSSKFWTRTLAPSKHYDNEDYLKCGVDTVCASHNTCCAKKPFADNSATFICCPLKQGVCCGTSCCPAGYHCIGGRKCEKSMDHKDLSSDRDYLVPI